MQLVLSHMAYKVNHSHTLHAIWKPTPNSVHVVLISLKPHHGSLPNPQLRSRDLHVSTSIAMLHIARSRLVDLARERYKVTPVSVHRIFASNHAICKVTGLHHFLSTPIRDGIRITANCEAATVSLGAV